MSKARQLAQKPSQPTGRKNMVYNPAMTVWQRGTSSTDPANGTYPTADRWKVTHIKGGAVDWSQSTETPSDFAYSLKADVTTADTNVASSDLYMVYQIIEDKNVSHLNLGTSNAKTITVSFWVRSSKTGTYCVSLLRAGIFTSEYTINTANTWEQKTVTIPLDTTRSWTQLELGFVLMSGSDYHIANETWVDGASNFAPSTSNQVNFLDNTANEFYLTGVQLEVGSTATEFEHRSYGEELALCQRYCQVINGSGNSGVSVASGHCRSNAASYVLYHFPVEMRVPPTGITVNSAGNFGMVTYGVVNNACTAVSMHEATQYGMLISLTTGSTSYTTGDGAVMYFQNGNGLITFDGAEL